MPAIAGAIVEYVGRRRKHAGRGTRLHAAGSAGAGRQLPLRPAADGGEQQHEDAVAHFWRRNSALSQKNDAKAVNYGCLL